MYRLNCKLLLLCTGISVSHSHKIAAISKCDQSPAWQVTTEDGQTENFDCVILTFPVPQILQLQGSIQQVIGMVLLLCSPFYLIQRTLAVCLGFKTSLSLNSRLPLFAESQPDVKSKMENVVFSSRFALGIFYDPDTSIDVPWSANYISGDKVLAFVAVDSKKRGQGGYPCSFKILNSFCDWCLIRCVSTAFVVPLLFVYIMH